MDTLQKQIWEKEECRIDNMIRQKYDALSWNPLVPSAQDCGIDSLFRHVLYVIDCFLEREDGPRELFIQLPVEELAPACCGVDVQENRWIQFCGSVINNLLRHTALETKRRIVPEPNEFEDRDLFAWINNRGHWIKALYNSKLSRMEHVKTGSVQHCLRDIAFFRLKMNRDITYNNTPEILEVLNGYLGELLDSRTNRQYKSAAVMSYRTLHPKANDNRSNPLWESPFFDSAVRFCHKHSDFTGRGKPAEIVVVIGDKNYRAPEIWNMTPGTKKIIYIGSEPPRDNLLTYAFSVREMYRYCAVNAEQIYNEPQIKYLKFPWLNERKQELEGILDRCARTDATLSPQIQQNCLRKLLLPFANALFDSDKLNALKADDDVKIAELLDIEAQKSTYDAIYDWYHSLSYEGKNPKWIYMLELSESGAICLPKWNSFKQKLKRSPDAPHIVLDGPSASRYDESYKYLLRYCLYAEVEALYYEGHEEFLKQSLTHFIAKEFAIYNGKLRQDWGTCINFNYSSDTGIHNEELQLEDFFKYENEACRHIYSPSETAYSVRFVDGSIVSISGDVLLRSEDETCQISLSDLLLRNHRGNTIVYYQTPENLDKIHCSALGCEPLYGKVQQYANLWKKRFMDYYQRVRVGSASDRDAVEIIHSKCRLSRNIISIYSKENNHLFLKEKKNMEAMCTLLQLSSDEKKYIMAAKRFIDEKSQFGRTLKQLVFNLCLEKDLVDEKQKDYWNKLSQHYSKDQILEWTCKENQIKNISEN